jgi:excisionase family DNA binding protein
VSAARPESNKGVPPPDRLLDVNEAAALLGLKSPRTLYKWACAGRMPSVKIGRLLRFRLCDLERLIANGERPAFAPPHGCIVDGADNGAVARDAESGGGRWTE